MKQISPKQGIVNQNFGSESARYTCEYLDDFLSMATISALMVIVIDWDEKVLTLMTNRDNEWCLDSP